MGSEFIENNLDCLEIIKNKFIKKTDSFNISYHYSLIELFLLCNKIKKNNNIEL